MYCRMTKYRTVYVSMRRYQFGKLPYHNKVNPSQIIEINWSITTAHSSIYVAGVRRCILNVKWFHWRYKSHREFDGWNHFSSDWMLFGVISNETAICSSPTQNQHSTTQTPSQWALSQRLRSAYSVDSIQRFSWKVFVDHTGCVSIAHRICVVYNL